MADQERVRQLAPDHLSRIVAASEAVQKRRAEELKVSNLCYRKARSLVLMFNSFRVLGSHQPLATNVFKTPPVTLPFRDTSVNISIMATGRVDTSHIDNLNLDHVEVVAEFPDEIPVPEGLYRQFYLFQKGKTFGPEGLAAGSLEGLQATVELLDVLRPRYQAMIEEQGSR